VIVYGDGLQERDFTFVEDIARGTVAALRPLGFEVINLGSDQPYPLLEIIRKIEHLTGAQARLEWRPQAPADVRATWADISKARQLLDWAPQTSMDEGLRACVQWYQAERSWASQVATLHPGEG
jgi:nucleoside-diphosphate-sugar epimerase